ncbi:S8 family serine peptidase [Aquincola tertiaricarbonis]|uniref:S8 family serine peptidase n=1 Tax=Aquincola tertiaricarbonis TaxID=391953 RepID=A0ABY4RZ63_AQUTE|nr:S8 family serine peptidase [Aquincola tertiaricarbonis]URI06173.1 S8 family serine peptidase [Aquincola tertiaricarbonis]
MTRHKIQRQVERILDESRQRTLSIIVQGQPDGLAETLRRAAEVAMQRRAITVASDLLPAPWRPSQARQAQAAAQRQQKMKVQALRRSGAAAIAPMQAAAFIRASRLARRSEAGGQPRPLALAGAAAMEIDRDDLARLPEELPGVLAIFPNRRVPVPPRLRAKTLPPEVERWVTHAWGLEDVGALSCWGAFDARGQGAKVAVLDTGVDATHPDLQGKVVGFAEFDAKGSVLKQGADQAWDADGHGTHVCGTIAGGRSSGRWIGMAPQAQLLVAKVLGKTGGTDEQILKGMEWAVAQGAEVINMSLGGLTFDPGVLDTYTAAMIAARAAGVPVVVAIGNDGAQTSGSPGNDFFALAVGAMDVQGRVAAFSGGRTHVVETSDAIDPRHLPLVYAKPDVAAPGVHVYSCIGKNKWEHLNGTSMAAPHAAGALALLLSRTAAAKQQSALLSLTGWDRSDALLQLLTGSVTDCGENGQDHRYGHGKLSALAAYGNAVQLGYLPAA